MIPLWYHYNRMKILNRKTDYAVRTLVRMARAPHADAKSSAARLAAELSIPGPFLRRILQRLEKDGFVSSQKGLKGGFALKKEPSKISVLDIINAFQGGINLNDCFMASGLCSNAKSCPLHKRLKRINKNVSDELALIDIASLAAGGSV